MIDKILNEIVEIEKKIIKLDARKRVLLSELDSYQRKKALSIYPEWKLEPITPTISRNPHYPFETY